MAFIVASIIGAGGAIAGGLISSHAAGKAADTQAGAANYAADLQKQASDQALAEQQREFNIGQGNLQPYLQTGYGALANLGYLMGISPQNGTAGLTTAVQPPTAPGAQTPNGGPAYGPDYQPAPVNSAMRFSNPNAPEALGNVEGPALPSTTNPTAPATSTSATNLGSLVNPNLGAPGSLLQGWNQQFQAPTDVTEQNDPGYKFRLDQALKAINANASAKGILSSGGTAKALSNYASDYASNEYGNVYNRALQQYQQNYNIFENNQANTYNRLAAVAGTGQTAANQLNSAGQNYANNVSGILMNTASNIGQQANNAAAARASGYVGGANALGGALSGGTNSIMNLYLMNQLMNGGGIPASAGAPGSVPISQVGGFGGLGI